MEGMDAELYALEYMIRDRLSNDRERARVAALLADAKRSQSPNAVTTRFTNLGRRLVNGVRRVPGELFHALLGRVPHVKGDAR